jgi:hypothetical protein
MMFWVCIKKDRTFAPIFLKPVKGGWNRESKTSLISSTILL